MTEVLYLACPPRIDKIAFAGVKGSIGLWNPLTDTMKGPKIVYKEDHSTAIALSPDGKFLVYTSAGLKIRAWNIYDGDQHVEGRSQPPIWDTNQGDVLSPIYNRLIQQLYRVDDILRERHKQS